MECYKLVCKIVNFVELAAVFTNITSAVIPFSICIINNKFDLNSGVN